jgi:hypothetical protein
MGSELKQQRSVEGMEEMVKGMGKEPRVNRNSSVRALTRVKAVTKACRSMHQPLLL